VICKVEGCVKPVGPSGAKGMCQAHYVRMRKTGSPTTPSQRAPLEVRFRRRVTKGSPDECWLWGGLFDRDGYGMISEGRRNRRAPRVSWMLAHGSYPPRHLYVLHRCDNPPCVNPDHLFLGTARDNLWDASRKGRLPGAQPGHRKPRWKLTPEQVAIIKATGNPYRGARSELARRYGVSYNHILRIQTGDPRQRGRDQAA
jgi:hypothetical protein